MIFIQFSPIKKIPHIAYHHMLRLIDHNNKHTTASAIQSINKEFIFARYILQSSIRISPYPWKNQLHYYSDCKRIIDKHLYFWIQSYYKLLFHNSLQVPSIHITDGEIPKNIPFFNSFLIYENRICKQFIFGLGHTSWSSEGVLQRWTDTDAIMHQKTEQNTCKQHGFDRLNNRIKHSHNNKRQKRMLFQYKNKEPKRKYSKISLKKRLTLVQQVIEQGNGLTKTAKKLNLKLSTAKLILRKYKETGRFYFRNSPKLAIEEANLVEKGQKENSQIIQSDGMSNEKPLQVNQTSIFTPQIYFLPFGESLFSYFGVYDGWNANNYYQFI